MIQKLTPRDYNTSNWSGGTTTQLAIWPPEASYGDRDFLWRVSSAVVELEESAFTALPDYERLISILEGELVLTHNGGPEIPLRPFQVHRFSGADETYSLGRCRDFNLMLRRDRVRGELEALSPGLVPRPLRPVAPGETRLLYCAAGSCVVTAHPPVPAGTAVRLNPGESLLLREPLALELTGPARLMLCTIQPL